MEDVRAGAGLEFGAGAGEDTVADVHELVRRAQAGDTVAMAAVMERFRPLVTRVAGRYRSMSFEDAFQEGCLALVRGVVAYSFEFGIPFAGYIQRKVHGDVRSAMRRIWTHEGRMRYASLGDDGEERELTVWDEAELVGGNGGGFGGADFTEGVVWREWIDGVRLSPRERTAVDGVMAGLTCGDMAEMAGVGVESAKTWRKRALRKLRAAVERW